MCSLQKRYTKNKHRFITISQFGTSIFLSVISDAKKRNNLLFLLFFFCIWYILIFFAWLIWVQRPGISIQIAVLLYKSYAMCVFRNVEKKIKVRDDLEEQ